MLTFDNLPEISARKKESDTPITSVRRCERDILNAMPLTGNGTSRVPLSVDESRVRRRYVSNESFQSGRSKKLGK